MEQDKVEMETKAKVEIKMQRSGLGDNNDNNGLGGVITTNLRSLVLLESRQSPIYMYEKSSHLSIINSTRSPPWDMSFLLIE